MTEKHPAIGKRGMVITNHPLASAAGAEMLAAGGNAIDAAIAAFFTLTVVEPMMVGILGGGMAHIRLADGTHTIIDNQSTAPAKTGPTTYSPDPNAPKGTMDTIGRKNAVGPTAVAVPGNLKGWCEALDRFGTFSRADVMEPAIRHASRGFRVTPYLHECISDCAADMVRDPEIARLYLPNEQPILSGARLVTSDYAATLRDIARVGPEHLYTGPLGDHYTAHMEKSGGYITRQDLTGYKTITRAPVRGTYRGFEIIGPPPPSSGPLHIIQMLNILEGFDIGALGFGTTETVHLLAEILKIAFADRAAATAEGPGGQNPLEILRRRAPFAYRSKSRPGMVRRGRSRGIALHHAPDNRRRRRQRRCKYADHQQPVRCPLYRARYRHDPKQLHARIRSPSKSSQLGCTGQAGDVVDVSRHRHP
jgi:gamma-glutamyltranspeptidase / glutathione hydrolase